jgi:sugar phosphate isomerase/epimerase
MLKLAAFADEISPDLHEQIKGCQDNGVGLLELRSVNKINVLDFDAALRKQIKTALSDAGMSVAVIASPIGKVKITDSWDEHFTRFKIAVDAAEYFAAPMIRIFSYYPPEGQSILSYRDEVIRRMKAKTDYVEKLPVTLVHENEAAIYAEKGRECLDLMRSINSPKLRTAFDFANFVQAGEHPMNNWPDLKPYTTHIHVKDALLDGGKVTPAGKGDGQVSAILADAYQSGYRGLLSLEPHLSSHGQFSGFSGPELFKVAADALKAICRENRIPLA